MSCSLPPFQRNFYVPKNEINDFTIDQNVIIKKNILPQISKINYIKSKEPENVENIDWYPCCNSYYPYTEDVDAFARVNHLLNSDLPVESPELPISYPPKISWEAQAQMNYLSSNPVSFIIIGKPGIGQQELGKALSSYWNCVYIDPEILIEEEVASGSRAGQCIEYNLRCGRAVGIDVILRLLEKRVQSESVKHRGFVLCCFPLIPNDLYEEDPVSSESAVFTVHEIFEDLIGPIGVDTEPHKPPVSISSKALTEEENEEEKLEDTKETEKAEASTVELPNTEVPLDLGASTDVCYKPEIRTDYEEQLNFIFKLLEKPYLIIYISCPNPDVISKRDCLRFDPKEKRSLNNRQINLSKLFEKFIDIGLSSNEIIEEFFDPNIFEFDFLKARHLVQLPINFPSNVSTQLDRYHSNIVNIIDEKVMLHNPEYFIKLDGRTDVIRMFSVLKTRLKVLPLQKVILPSLLNVSEGVEEGEGLTFKDPPVNFLGLSMEDCYKQLSRRQTVGPIFKYYWSDWMTKCPVNLKNGIIKDGDPNYAVRFMNKIYFLADHDAYVQFYRNPRPFLLPPNPRNNCKIFVFGPENSGKTLVSQCLAYIFNGVVLTPFSMLQWFIQEQKAMKLDKIRQQVMAEAIHELNEMREKEWQEKENQRKIALQDWKKGVVDTLNKLKQQETEMGATKFTAFPLKAKMPFEIEKYINELQPFGIDSFIVSQENVERMMVDSDFLLSLVPEKLSKETPLPEPATVFDDYVVNKVAKTMENTSVEVDNASDIDIIIKAIRTAEDRYSNEEGIKGGWIIDGMMTDLNMLEVLNSEHMAEFVIYLYDNEEVATLIRKLDVQTPPVDFCAFLKSIGQFDASLRVPIEECEESKLVESYIHNILDEVVQLVPYINNTEKKDPRNLMRESYKARVLKFMKDWHTLEDFFTERKVPILKVSLEDKQITDVMKEVVKLLENVFSTPAVKMTDEDIAEDIFMLSQSAPVGEAGEDDQDQVKEDYIESNRRYGYTYKYCPVCFTDKWLLKFGKEDFACLYEGKTYLMCSNECMDHFLDNPKKFLVNTPCNIPPPRVCLIGSYGIDKVKLGKMLAKNLGVHHVSYQEQLQKIFGDSEDIFNKYFTEEFEEELQSYLTDGSALPIQMIESIVKKLWFQEPYKSDGFLICDFPKRPSDLQVMIELHAVPDIILNLLPSDLNFQNDLLQSKLNAWQENVDQRVEKFQQEQQKKIVEIEEKRSQRFKQLMEEKRRQRYDEKLHRRIESPHSEPEGILTSESQVSFDSVAEEFDQRVVMDIVNEELPAVEEEVLEIEDINTVKLSFLDEINFYNGTEQKFLTEILTTCPQIDFKVNTVAYVNETKAIIELFLATKNICERNSIFERCYDVSVELSERLLQSGYFFLSKFGKTCPVQYYEDWNPVQMYLPMEQKFDLYPMIHKQFIYFICGKDNRNKFKKDPLKYLSKSRDFKFPLIPLRMSIIGPPKSGKTVLAERFANYFGLKKVSCGSAARYVLAYLPNSFLAENLENVLRQGWELTDEMVTKCLEAASVDGRALTQGIVFDGFPNAIFQVRHLANIGLIPNIVIDLQANEVQVLQRLECLQEGNHKTRLPAYGQQFLKHLLDEFDEYSQDFREWLDKEYQIISKVKTDTTIWDAYERSLDVVMAVFSEFKHYHKHIAEDWPLRLANMLVTPLEFSERQCSFKNYCPCCLHFDFALTFGGNPPDRTGLVQFRDYFYWICDDHMETFLKIPEQFIIPYNRHKLPDKLPIPIDLSEFPEQVYENGMCVVCYKTKNNLTMGCIEFAADFDTLIYIFDNLKCLNKFLRNPFNFNVTIKYTKRSDYPSLDYRELPLLGMLEQYVAKYIITALNIICRLRPVIPGLSIQASAAVTLGLYLKVYNEKLPEKYKVAYRQAMDLMEARKNKFKQYLQNMKDNLNPYLHYEEIMPSYSPYRSESKLTSTNSTEFISRMLSDVVDGIDYF